MTITLRNMTLTVSQPLTALEQQVGNTPLLPIRNITAHLPENIKLYAKAEWFNPGGSIKDRAAFNMIRTAEADGRLRPGKTILESTSGNTGIALAMFGAARGYPVQLFMPETASPERVKILRAYGADITLTPAAEGSDGAMRAVRELAASEPDRYFYTNQYDNPANWQAHYTGTGIEIWGQTQGQITHFVAVMGTSGTFTGTTRRLKTYNPAIRAVSLGPDTADHRVEGTKHMPTAVKPGIYNPALADSHLIYSTEAAYAMVMRLAREEGLLVGLSSGAALVGALRVAEMLAARGEAATLVTVFPDNGYKYLSRPPYEA